jgi:endo-1,4-beta-xylanase
MLAGLAGLPFAACDSRAAPPAESIAALKDLAGFPMGVCVMSGQVADAGWRAVADRHFDQLTPEWEMKMEYILQDSGSYRWEAPDAIAAYAAASGKRLWGHALIWYSQGEAAFAPLDGTGARFEAAYLGYIAAVAGRYRGRVVGWDVVNEPVAEDGDGYRDCIWRRNLGMGYVQRAFEHAAEADPAAVRVLNEYNLETLPAKRRTFLRLAEELLRRGAPLTGIGTQSHVDVDLAPGAYRTAMRELAGLGLPVHVSELDISTNGRWGREVALKQARVAEEVVGALMDLPPAQRLGLTVWGARDGDNWLTRPRFGRAAHAVRRRRGEQAGGRGRGRSAPALSRGDRTPGRVEEQRLTDRRLHRLGLERLGDQEGRFRTLARQQALGERR